MLKRIKTLYLRLLSKKEQSYLTRLQYFIFLLTLSEVMFVASFGDMLAWVNNPESSRLYNLADKFLIHDERILAICFLFLMIFGSAMALFSSWKIALIPNKIGAHISARLYEYYLSKDNEFHESISSASLISKLSQETARVTNQILYPLTQLNASSVLGSVLIAFLLVKYPLLVVLGGGFIVTVYAVIYLYVSNRLAFHGRTISKTHNKSIEYMKDGFQGFTDYVTTNAVPEIVDNYKKNIFRFGLAAGIVRAYNTIPKFALEAGIVLVAILYVFYVKFIINAEVVIDAASAGTLGLVLMKLLPVIHKVYAMLSIIIANLSALDSIQEDLLCSNKKEHINHREPLKTLSIIDNEIKFENVSFEKNGQKILDKVNIKIGQGEKVALVGGSGSGKSTLMKLASGLWSPTEGRVLIGNTDISKVSREELYDSLSYCPQQIHISSGTIKNNILMSERLEGDSKLLDKSIESSLLAGVITELPKGIETGLAENAASLSGGQRQRIGIARVFYRNNSVLMFDESTSALDSKTEKMLIDNMLKEKATVLFISHRVKSLLNFHRIYFMEGGQIIDVGNYHELSLRNRRFEQLIIP